MPKNNCARCGKLIDVGLNQCPHCSLGLVPQEAAPIKSPNRDPKKAAGDLKAPMHLLPTEALRQEAQVLALGAEKYGIYNWRESEGVATSTYAAAIMRHLCQFLDGEDIDEESGCSHLAHIKATCSILIDADRIGKLTDDRPTVQDDNVKIKFVEEMHFGVTPDKMNDPQCGPIMSQECAFNGDPDVCKVCNRAPSTWSRFKLKGEEDGID